MRKYKVGDRLQVKLSGGRIVEATVKAVVDSTDGVRLQVLFAFKDFYGRINNEDPYKKQFAAKDFADKGEQFIRTHVLARQRRETQKKWMDEAGAKLEAEMAAKRAADEAQAALDDAPDPWLEEMRAGADT